MPVIPLLTTIKTYLPPDRARFVEDALEFAKAAHANQRRESGEPYIEHPIATAQHLAEMRLDATTLAAALLHDTMEDCGVTFGELSSKFGAEVARLVDGVTKLKKLDEIKDDGDNGAAAAIENGRRPLSNTEAARVATLRKMLVATAEDIRVVLIKLSDRLHNMRTLSHLPPDRQQRIARETLEIYAPLAHRLGMADMRWQLEDAAFRYLMPKEYKAVSRLVNRKRQEREEYAAHVSQVLDGALKEQGVNALVTGRPKHLYSTYNKMLRYGEQGRKFDEIYDLTGLRVMTDTVASCYAALGVVHTLWKPVQGQVDDYIANPKNNFYQSLHTSVICEGGYPVEVQIRTKEMHRVAEEGVAAHWAYKEGDEELDARFEQKMSWLKQLLDWQREMSGDEEYLDSVKTDILRDQVFVNTPKGDVIDLPAGATPLDFAFRIHTDLGYNCSGAVVNGKLVSLNTQLRNGDTVEIKKSKSPRGPSLDWLNSNLGYVVTGSAKAKVRAWFRRQERAANIERGREQLRKDTRRLNVSVTDEAVALMFGFKAVDDLVAAIGSGDLGTEQIIEMLAAHPQAPDKEAEALPPKPLPPPDRGSGTGVVVMGTANMLTRVALCCSPVYGDEIAGYITRGRGVTVHRRNCPTILASSDTDRLIQTAWGHSEAAHPTRIVVEGYDRVGLLKDITNVIAAENVNIHSMATAENLNASVSIVSFTVYTTGVEQLSRLFSKIGAIPGVRSVQRTAVTVKTPGS
ncbi:MAG: bifunctional (p)ppGpp synthetase/guanosine-3',5'-bis(diphosphate) 3'-pyrophosphohydrolase [Dehalococcoidia bacterium]|nr:bifunctional (p)ppGpp synthetase/guanosine-3',5'-bis(diphosphate) 3'-pyrophosphohydrolase [Dehalococcoidia bacterium]MSQ35214.1 bifunctional (p)ppGpp synthetase/guanosine-3',5'-bis(diphosphate) 3'-pyrophosphohydrolase [Dehalococcoidia bacterium]